MDGFFFKLVERFCAGPIGIALTDTPVVMLIGPRQCGKTTLVQQFTAQGFAYVTLDDDTVLAAARSDPAGFVRGFQAVAIDEVQRAPELLRAIKLAVDNDRRPGRFILTGSANILTLPMVSESLAGRMEMVTLMPISRAEIAGKRPEFLRAAFAGKMVDPGTPLIGGELLRAVLTGGYPEMLRRESPRRRQVWARDYVKAIVLRDVRDIAEVAKLDRLPVLLQVLAHHSGQMTNFTQIGGQIGIDDKTTRRYTGILEQLFLVQQLPPWFRNQINRLVKTPKLHFLDSGLLAALESLTAEQIARDRTRFGALLETFVYGEIRKLTTWVDENYSIAHYRDKDQDEVDFVVEDEHGAVVCIEVKASATVRIGDFKGIKKVREACGSDLKLGVVLYDGETVIPFGDRLWAAPVSCLWN
jgi:predicted AAA+ superfamily ATPase